MRINNRYNIIKKLGKGSQGSVFMATDTMGRTDPIALKTLGASAHSAMFRFEFAQAKRIEHPHLVKVYELGVISTCSDPETISLGTPFFTQELIDGNGSREWIAGLPQNEVSIRVAKLGIEVARALCQLHNNGLLHRDVKPSNILVNQQGEATLIDLGLSVSKTNCDGFRAGTIGFMAPESLHGFPDERSDIYSLGVTLATLITGKPPGRLKAPPNEPPAAISKKLWATISQMMKASSSHRPQSAEDVIRSIGRAMGSQVLGAKGTYNTIDAISDADDEMTQAARARSAELIGRDPEQQFLGKRLAQTLERSPCRSTTIALVGPHGVGKTRLFRTVVVNAQLDCVRRQQRPPGILHGDLRTIVGAVRRTIGSSPSPIVATWLDGDLSQTNKGIPEPMTQLLVDGLAEGLEALPHPTAVLIQDGDKKVSQALLNRLSASACPPKNPLFVAAEIRNQDNCTTLTDDVTKLNLAPLRLEDEQKMLTATLGTAPDPATTAGVHKLTGGIPLLTEAVLTTLLSKGFTGNIDPKHLKDLSLKGTPEDLVLGGLMTGLSDSAKGVAEALSVVDIPASLEEVLGVAALQENDHVLSGVRRLEKNGWLDNENGLLSLKGLVSKSLYRTLPSDKKAQLHRNALDVLKERTPQDAACLATHAFFGGAEKKAQHYARKAADQLKASGDLVGASEQLEILLSLPSTPNTKAVKTELARLSRQTGRYERVMELTSWPDGDLVLHAPKAALERAATLRLMGKSEEALTLLNALIPSKQKNVATEASALAARMDLDLGHIQTAAKRLAHIEPIPDPILAKSGVLSTAGLVAMATGDPKKAKGLFEAGLSATAGMGDVRNQARFNGLLGMVFHGDNNWMAAKKSYARALSLANKAGDRHGAATYAVNLAAACTELDQIQEALEAYKTGLKELSIVGQTNERVQAGANYAQLLYRLGDVEGAETATQEALKRSDKETNGRVRCLALLVYGDVLISRKKLQEAETVLHQAKQLSIDSDDHQEQAICCIKLAKCAVEKKDTDTTEKLINEVEAIGYPPLSQIDLELHRLKLQACQMTNGDTNTALDALLRRLPKQDEPIREKHLESMATASIIARETGHTNTALNLAQKTIDALAEVRKKIPSFHRQSLPQWEKELHAMVNRSQEKNAIPIFEGSWEHLVRINTRLNSETRIGRLLEMVMDAALDITGAERGFLLMMNTKGDPKIRCARNIDQNSLSPDDNNFSRTVATKAFETGEPVLTTDAKEDHRFDDMLSVVNLNLRYIVALPLKVKGKSTGTIYLDSRRGGHFDDRRLAMLETLAHQAAVALTNAKLQSENRRSQRSIARLNKQLQTRLENREDELKKTKRELRLKTNALITKYNYSEIIAQSKPMAEIFKLLDKIVSSDLPVVVRGESGTGKELVARAIHFNGARKNKPFVAENCAAIPEPLFESVLFGHVKGAFTGAVYDTRGLFNQAHEGTLFLDEISEMPTTMQRKLLRVLQDGKVRPVGGNKTETVNVRIVVASNTDLTEQVKQGTFRQDLFYRLNVISVTLPPLRNRKEDIPLLASHFIAKHCGGKKKSISRDAVETLMNYPWPGNVRQLENEIMRAIVLSDDRIDVSHLSEEVFCGGSQHSNLSMDLDMNRQVDGLKRRLVKSALKRTQGNQTAAAELLGISRFGLQKMLARFGLSK